MKARDVNCPTCGATAGDRCRSIGRLLSNGDLLKSYHAARKRSARHLEGILDGTISEDEKRRVDE